MKRIFAVGIVLALAAGCGTTTNGGGGTTTQDTTVATDTTSDTGTVGDTTSGTGDTKSDTKDTSTADVKKDSTASPTKCDPKNNACMNTCVASACAKESGACMGDAKCSGALKCLNGCQTAPLPADPTATTCSQKCIDTAGQTAMDEFYAAQTCMGENCITCKAGDQNCQAACASQLCIDSLVACEASFGCKSILTCLETEKCQDQACFTACMNKFPDGQTDFSNFVQCYQTNANACD